MGKNDDNSESDLDLGESGVDLDSSSSWERGRPRPRSSLPGPADQIADVDVRVPKHENSYDLSGLNLDGLIIQRKLGEGGMGEVWLAHHEDLDIPVAVKVLPSHLASDQQFLMRFLREARAVAKLDHPNIVRVLDAGRREVEGEFLRLMVMEYLEGSDAQVLRKNQASEKLEPQLAASITLATAKALKYAHGKGVVHRDIKPANILVSKDRESVKVLDFGLAKLRSGTVPREIQPEKAESQTGGILGTPQYMAPEQGEGKITDSRVDIYSLGVTLYELLTGTLPFEGDTVFSIIEGHVRKPMEFPSAAFSDVPPVFRELIAGMCEKKPEDRWPLKEVIEKLEHFLGVSSGGRTSTSAYDSDAIELKTNLQQRKTSFVGRQDDLGKMGELLQNDDVQLITLVGPGGVGKTRISQEFGLAQAEAGNFEGGVWFCDLTEARSVDGICGAVSVGLDVPLTQDDGVAQLEAALALRDPMLLILDNFEQVVDFAAETLGRWMAKAPKAKFLASSREPLHLEGERPYPLGPLSSSWGRGRPRPHLENHRGWHERGYLPHFDSAETYQFLTFRLADSLPQSLSKTDERISVEDYDVDLDRGMGDCVLRDERVAEIVRTALNHFDGERYNLIAYTIMPNHVHVLVEMIDGHQLSKIVQSWKTFTAKQINALLSRTGTLWQSDYFDRFIRDETHFSATVEYIIQNPVKAGLCHSPEDWKFTEVKELKNADVDVRAPREEAPAIQLFIDRASVAKRGFKVDDASRAAIAKIVDQLDGIPLAIELAASRCSAMTPERILKEMPRRFDLLKGRRRDASARQATLRGAIDWSWNLLEPWEQLALVQCSVFQGGFFLEAAEAVLDLDAAADAPFAMDVIEGLVEKSLLVATDMTESVGDMRYRMLESIRQYAGEKMVDPKAIVHEGKALTGAQPAEDLLLRHAEHYAEYVEYWAKEINGPNAVEALDRIELEYDNFFGIQEALEKDHPVIVARVLRYTASTLRVRGPWKERIPRTERAIKNLGEEGELSLRIELLYVLAMASFDAGRLENLKDASEGMKTLAESLDADDPSAASLRLLAARAQSIFHFSSGEFGAAAEILEKEFEAQGLTIEGISRTATGCDSRFQLAIASYVGFRGSIHSRLDESVAALACHKEAEAISRETGHRLGVATFIGNQGTAYWSLKDYDRAEACFKEALSIFHSMGERNSYALFVGNLGGLAGSRGDWEFAFENYLRSEAIYREIGSQRQLASCVFNQGYSLSKLGRVQEAWEAFEEAEAVNREIGDKYGVSQCLLGKTTVLLDRGEDLETALELIRECVELRSEMGMQKSTDFFNAMAALAAVEHRLGMHEEARARALAAKALGEELKIDRHEKHGPKKGAVLKQWQYVDEVLGAPEE